MEYDVLEDKKLVTIWLNNAERNDPAVAESLKSIYKEYKKKKYKVAVFKSGTVDLWETTSALLIHNRDRMASQEARQG